MNGLALLLLLGSVVFLLQSCSSTGALRTLYVPPNVKPDTVGPNYLHNVSQVKYWDRISPANRATNFAWWDSSGTVREMADYYNKVIVISFFGTWSPPSDNQLLFLDSIYTQDTNAFVIAVAMREGVRGGKAVQKLDSFARARNIPYEVLVGSPDFGFTYGGIDVVPTTFVIDQEHRITATFEGFVTEDKLRAAITKAEASN